MAKTTNQLGDRLIDVDDRLLKEVERMSGIGMPVKHIAHVLGYSKATFERRVEEVKELREALEKGRSKGAEAIYNTAFALATSGKCPAMTIFWLKCREEWKEGQRDEEMHRVIKATTDNVAKLYEIATTAHQTRGAG